MNRHLFVSSALVCAAVWLFSHQPSEQLEPAQPAEPAKKFASSPVIGAGRQPPINFIRPENLGVRPAEKNYNHPARIRELVEAGDMTGLQSATLSWFEHDPSAALDWLSLQPSLEEFQPAISHIAHHISDQGNLDLALKWAALLTDATLHDTTVFDILALALRNRQLSPADIPAGLTAEPRFGELLNGAPGD